MKQSQQFFFLVLHAREKSLKYLCHLFPVGFWVYRSFCQQNWVFLGRDADLVVKGVVPNLKKIARSINKFYLIYITSLWFT